MNVLGTWKEKQQLPPSNRPLVGNLMKVFAAIPTVAPGTSTDRPSKQTVQCAGEDTPCRGPPVLGRGKEMRRAGRLQEESLGRKQTGFSPHQH